MDTERILVLDFGSQYSHLIVRKIRDAQVYSELMPCTAPIDQITAFKPKGIILSGAHSSIYQEETHAPITDQKLWKWLQNANIPVLAIAYSLHEMIQHAPTHTDSHQFVAEQLQIINNKNYTNNIHPIFHNFDLNSQVWLSPADKLPSTLPPHFHPIASTPTHPIAAIAHDTLPFIGLQFHPEVEQSPQGVEIIKSFIYQICQAQPKWNMQSFLQTELKKIKETIPQDAVVIGAMSGGVDSTVAACLMHKALGDRFRGFMIDTGLLRLNEGVQVIKRLKEIMPGFNVICIDASEKYFSALKRVTEPEEKRKIIGRLFVEEFELACEQLKVNLDNAYLLQGTLYPDVIESCSFKGPSHAIKTHHNVGGLPEKMRLKPLEPLRELFKDEVRLLGEALGIPSDMVWRHPFPGPGLGVRIIGEVTRERVSVLQRCDAIFLEELRRTGHYGKIGQAFAVLLPESRSVGVKGDVRTYEMTCVLRAVETSDYMTAEWYRMPYEVLACVSGRITSEVEGINRVVYDVSAKPPATIEWE